MKLRLFRLIDWVWRKLGLPEGENRRGDEMH